MKSLRWKLMANLTLLFAHATWPDAVDRTALILFFAAVIVLPVIGYWFMVVDIRAYLRALRGALIRVVNHFPDLPVWAREETPSCIRALGLQMPCTEFEVKRAYRQMAEELHPDRGGDRRRFLQLQTQFERAIRFLRDREAASGTHR